jgi:hypothetical protein
MTSLFCRHNRFTAECPICSKGSVLERTQPERRSATTSKPPGTRRQRAAGTREGPARTYVGPHVAAGPFHREARIYDVRIEQVPGGLRLAEWRGGALERQAPVLPASALRQLIDDAAERGLIRFSLPDPIDPTAESATAASPGQAGDMREELRVERADEPGTVRVARYIYWPGEQHWELQESPVMLPEKRFEEALTAAANAGLL